MPKNEERKEKRKERKREKGRGREKIERNRHVPMPFALMYREEGYEYFKGYLRFFAYSFTCGSSALTE